MRLGHGIEGGLAGVRQQGLAAVEGQDERDQSVGCQQGEAIP